VYFEVSPAEAAMPKKLHISLDGRSRARVREFDFDVSAVAVSNRSAKGLTVTRWPVKAVARVE
jgi:topoisomerase-4 subunit A